MTLRDNDTTLFVDNAISVFVTLPRCAVINDIFASAHWKKEGAGNQELMKEDLPDEQLGNQEDNFIEQYLSGNQLLKVMSWPIKFIF